MAPVRSPRRFTGVAATNDFGSVIASGPPAPACSHTRSTVPPPSGFGPNAVTATPFRERAIPSCAGASGPGRAVERAAASGTRASIEGEYSAGSAAK